MIPNPHRVPVLFPLLALLLLVSGCANIEPWERNNLAKPQMAADPNPLNEAFREHLNFSREGTSGGAGGGGGGCGCN